MWSASVISRTPRRTRLSCTVPIARSLPGITRLLNTTVSPSPSSMRGCVSGGDAGERAARLALAAGDQDQQIVVGDVVGLVLAGERRHVRAGSRIRAPPPPGCAGSGRPGHAAPGVAGGQRDRLPRARRCWRSRSPRRGRAGRGSARTARGARRPPSRNGLPPSRWWNRRPSPARPRRRARRSAASSVGGPTSGSGRASSRRCAASMPAGVRITSACASGIECATRRKRRLNGGQLDGAAGRHDDAASPGCSSCASASLRRSTAAANGLA